MGLWKEFVAACSNKPKKPSKSIQQQSSLEAPTSSTVSSQSSHASKSQPQVQQPAGVSVDFQTTNGLHHTKPPSQASRQSSLGRSASQQVSPSCLTILELLSFYRHCIAQSCKCLTLYAVYTGRQLALAAERLSRIQFADEFATAGLISTFISLGKGVQMART